MTNPSPHPFIVVGYDGSVPARAAVDRAIEQVGDHGRLIVVYAYAVPADYIGASYYQDMLDTALDRANLVMDKLRAREPRLADIDWFADVVPGDAATAIVRAAEVQGADEIIIGTRGVGRVGAFLGSVANQVLHRATCPVTVIPERAVTAADVAVPAAAA
jgi:nucleotide-binding universal stress UspA family protein